MQFIKGQWTKLDRRTVQKDYDRFLKGNITEVQLERKYHRPFKSIVNQVNYQKYGPARAAKKNNKAGMTVIKAHKRNGKQIPAHTRGASVLTPFSNGNAKGLYTPEQVVELLKEAQLGRGWKGKVKKVLNLKPKVNWEGRKIESRATPHLEAEGVAILVLTKSGDVKAFSSSGYSKWKKGMKKGLNSIHGPGVRA